MTVIYTIDTISISTNMIKQSHTKNHQTIIVMLHLHALFIQKFEITKDVLQTIKHDNETVILSPLFPSGLLLDIFKDVSHKKFLVRKSNKKSPSHFTKEIWGQAVIISLSYIKKGLCPRF